jgi:ABC-type nickel/cobalt efflux system permease component RcnA
MSLLLIATFFVMVDPYSDRASDLRTSAIWMSVGVAILVAAWASIAVARRKVQQNRPNDCHSPSATGDNSSESNPTKQNE